MQKLHNDLSPIEALALLALAAVWAAATLARLLFVPALALLLALAGWWPAAAAPDSSQPRPQQASHPQAPAAEPQAEASAKPPAPRGQHLHQAPATAAAPAPAPAPLAELAELAAAALEPLTVAQLRAQARSAGLPRALSRTGRRAELLAALGWAAVAAA